MAEGTVIRFDEGKGYGFVSPDGGGDDVFIHVNDLTFDKRQLTIGTRVEFAVEDGERGPKADAVRLVRAAAAPAATGAAPSSSDDVLCDVLSPGDWSTEVTELLLSGVPTLTAEQILQVRAQLLRAARGHGWVEG